MTEEKIAQEQIAIHIDPNRMARVYQRQVIQLTTENAMKTAAIEQLQDDIAMLRAKIAEYEDADKTDEKQRTV